MNTVVLRRAGARHPEAGAAVVAAAAWLLLLLPAAGGTMRTTHDAVHRAAAAPAEAFGWLAMATAMMVPTALPVSRRLALTSLWRRRRRTVSLFLASYVAVWALFGAAVLPLVALVDVDATALLPAVLLTAAAWELTRAKWRGVRACRLVDPLPPSGRAADRACCQTGVRYGARCVVACWPLMLAMAVAGHAALGLMLTLSALAVTEKRAPEPSRLAPYGAGLLALAACTAAIVPAT
jgi:predicted metal-binding membrane protein